MDDAYTIGITLALENGVSEGLAVIRRDLDTLSLALSQTMRGLAELREASDRTLGSAGLDLKRLAAEGQRLLGKLPSAAVSPEPRRLAQQPKSEPEQTAPPSLGAPRPGPAPVRTAAGLPVPARPPIVAQGSVATAGPAIIPRAPSPPPRPADPDALLAPVTPAPRPASSAPANAAPAAARELPLRLELPAASMAPARTPLPQPPAGAAPVSLLPVSPPTHAELMPPVLTVPPAAVAPSAPATAPPTGAPRIPTSVRAERVSVAPIAPPPQVEVKPLPSVAPITAEPAGGMAAPLAPAARELLASELVALARSMSPPPAQFPEPAPAQLIAFAAPALPIALPAARDRALAVGDSTRKGPALPYITGQENEPRIDTPGRRDPIHPLMMPAVHRPTPQGTSDAAPKESAPESVKQDQHWELAFRVEGPVLLDGQLLGRWMSEHLAREAGRAPVGPTGFDARAGMIWPGAPIQS